MLSIRRTEGGEAGEGAGHFADYHHGAQAAAAGAGAAAGGHHKSCGRDGREGDGGRGSQAVPRGYELRQDFYDGISPDEVKNLSLILLYELVA